MYNFNPNENKFNEISNYKYESLIKHLKGAKTHGNYNKNHFHNNV